MLDVDVDPADPRVVDAATAGGGVMKLEKEQPLSGSKQALSGAEIPCSGF